MKICLAYPLVRIVGKPSKWLRIGLGKEDGLPEVFTAGLGRARRTGIMAFGEIPYRQIEYALPTENLVCS